MVTSRGGVENTRLEAKNTKKIRGQGQGQPFGTDHCWALLQIDPQISKLWTQDFDLRICKPISYCKHFHICDKKKLKSTANQQHVSLQFTKK